MWGILSASYGEKKLPRKIDPESIQAAYEREIDNRLSALPIESIEEEYDIDVSKLRQQEDMTLCAYDIDGKLYVGGYDTRSGKYPYPGKLRGNFKNIRIF